MCEDNSVVGEERVLGHSKKAFRDLWVSIRDEEFVELDFGFEGTTFEVVAATVDCFAAVHGANVFAVHGAQLVEHVVYLGGDGELLGFGEGVPNFVETIAFDEFHSYGLKFAVAYSFVDAWDGNGCVRGDEFHGFGFAELEVAARLNHFVSVSGDFSAENLMENYTY